MKKIFSEADILLPKKGFEKWAVIACDQYTSQPEYWEKLGQFVGDDPSALKMILPEVYLKDEPEKRIEKINAEMKKYLDDGLFVEYKDAMIFVERTLPAAEAPDFSGPSLCRYRELRGRDAVSRAGEPL